MNGEYVQHSSDKIRIARSFRITYILFLKEIKGHLYRIRVRGRYGEISATCAPLRERFTIIQVA